MTYTADIVAKNPVSYWRLGETTGTTAVDEMGLHDGSFVQPGLQMGEPGGIPNDTNTSFEFTGAAAQIISTGGTWAISTSAYTVMALVKMHTTPPASFNATLISMSQDATQRMRIYARRNATNNRLSYWDNTNTHQESTETLTLNTWEHVAVVVNGTSLKFFVAGANVGSLTITAPGDTYSTVGIGAAPSVDPMKGWLDEVAIWDTALTDTEISDLATSWANNTANANPVVNAGADVTNAEPGTLVPLDASATDDGSVVSLVWTQTGGTPTGVISNGGVDPCTFEVPAKATAETYVLTATATDNTGLTGTDSINIGGLAATEYAAIGGVLVPILPRGVTS